MTHTATIGSISHGTYRAIDLLDAFATELDRFESERDDVREALAVLSLMQAGWAIEEHMGEACHDLVNAMQDALGEFAPPYCYFGAHEGDGSDFGFWPLIDAIDELPKFNDLSEVPDGMDDDYVVVNDHGNVSVYGADGTLIWDCV